MSDEQLRMAAVVTDGFSAPLKTLQTLLGQVGSHPAGKQMQRDWKGVSTEIGKVTGEIRNSLTPALAAAGVAGFSAGAALGGIVTGVRNFSSQTQSLRLFGRETGLTVSRLRALGEVGERFGVSSSTMQGGLRSFADAMVDIRKRTSEAAETLRTMGQGDFVEKLVSAPNMTEAVNRLFAGLADIPSPVMRRRVLKLLGLPEDFSTIVSELGKGAVKEIDVIEKRLGGALGQRAETAAKRFEEAMASVRTNLEALRIQAFTPLLEETNKLFKAFQDPSSFKFLSDELDAFKAGLAATKREIEAIISLWGGLKEFFSGSKTDGATHGVMPEASIGETTRNPEISRRRMQMDQARRMIDVLDESIARQEGRGDNAAESRRRRDALVEQLKRLSDEIQALRRGNGGGMIQQQSFSGGYGGGFGGLIQRASVRGFRPGGWAGGGMGGSVSPEPEDHGGRRGGGWTRVDVPANSGNSRSGAGRAGRSRIGGDGGGGLGQDIGGREAPFRRRSGIGRGAYVLFDQKAPEIMARLQRDFGITKEDSAAVLGNLGHESAGFKAFNEGGGGPGRGWAQWTDPGRKRRFFEYAQRHGLDPKSDEANYGFLRWELQNTHRGAITAMRRETSLEGKMRAFENIFENAGIKAYGSRMMYARRAMGLPETEPGPLASSPNFPPIRTRQDWSAASGATPVPYPHLWNRGWTRAGGSDPTARVGDSLLGRAFSLAGGATPQKVEGNVHITLSGGAEKLNANIKNNGELFKDAKVSRGSQVNYDKG